MTALAPGRRARQAFVFASVLASLATTAEAWADPSETASTASTASAPPATPRTAAPTGESFQKSLGIATAGAGVIALSLGGVLGLATVARRNEADDHCRGDLCDATGVGLVDAARGDGQAAALAAVAGGLLLAGGLTLYLTAPRDLLPTQTLSVAMGPSGAYLRFIR